MIESLTSSHSLIEVSTRTVKGFNTMMTYAYHATRSLLGITTGSQPVAIAFEGAQMWVANSGSDTVSVYRASDGTLVQTIPTGRQPCAIAFDGCNMWVTNYGSNNVSVIHAS